MKLPRDVSADRLIRTNSALSQLILIPIWWDWSKMD
jgi:hypothetical protein